MRRRSRSSSARSRSARRRWAATTRRWRSRSIISRSRTGSWVEDSLRPLHRALDFIHARRWAGKVERKDYEQTWVDLLNQEYGENLLESLDLLSKTGIRLPTERQQRAHRVVQADDPLWREYVAAREMAETGTRVARECGDYPLLSGGDVNLYSLFVERAAALIQPRGMVGLLTPSGIAADKGAAEFFGSISSGGRLAALFDFENRNNPGGSYFPDVDSRFKFCALVFGGKERSFAASRCAFCLHDVAELKAPGRMLELTAADFEAVNPNTGGAPIFRTRRDADITTGIYRRQPVLVDRRPERALGGGPAALDRPPVVPPAGSGHRAVPRPPVGVQCSRTISASRIEWDCEISTISPPMPSLWTCRTSTTQIKRCCAEA
jgi:hypothetical protein